MREKDAEIAVLKAQLRIAEDVLAEAVSTLRQATGVRAQLRRSNGALLRARGVDSLGGALDMLLEVHAQSSTVQELEEYFSQDDGAVLLEQINDLMAEQGQDGNFTAESLTSTLFEIKANLRPGGG